MNAVASKPNILMIETALRVIARNVINVSSLDTKAVTVAIVCSAMGVLAEMNVTRVGDIENISFEEHICPNIH